MSSAENGKGAQSAKSAEVAGSGAACPECGLEVPPGTVICPNDGTQLVAEPQAGQLFEGKFEFISLLGRGGMSVVWKARQPFLDKIVAVKMLQASASTDPSGLARFAQEAKAASNLDHPNIIRVTDFGISTYSQPYLVMDFLEGEDLSDLIEKQGRLSVADAVEVAIMIADALSHAHSHGVIHRDLKPSNIMLCKDASGRPLPKIVDFGIAKLTENDSSGPKLTQTGEIFGSPSYMSPEQCMGQRLDARADIYSFGCLTFEVLTGRTPFQGANPMDTIFKHLNTEAPSLKAVCPDGAFPQQLEAVVARCLSKSPEDRYQSMDEVCNDLRLVKSEIENPGSQKKLIVTRKTDMKMLLASFGGVLVVIAGILWVASSPSSVEPVARVRSAEPAAVDNAPDLSGESIDNIKLPLWVEQYPNATSFNPSHAKINDSSIEDLLKLKKLRELSLPKAQVSNTGLEVLGKTEAPIKFLDLSGTLVSDDGLRWLTRLRLERLDLERTLVGDAGMKYVSMIPTLRSLNVATGCLTDKGLEPLTRLPELQSLQLDGNKVTDAGLKTLSRIKTLKSLNLETSAAGLITIEGVKALCTLPELEHLELENAGLGDEATAALAQVPSLVKIDLSDCPITDRGVRNLSKRKDLVVLCLDGTKITDAALGEIAANHGELRQLSLKKTAITDAGLEKLSSLRSLHMLDLSGCKKLTDQGILKLRQALPACNFKS